MLVIGDRRQHQGFGAGRPFEQMQDAGMRTSQLNEIMRQRDTELLNAVFAVRATCPPSTPATIPGPLL